MQKLALLIIIFTLIAFLSCNTSKKSAQNIPDNSYHIDTIFTKSNKIIRDTIFIADTIININKVVVIDTFYIYCDNITNCCDTIKKLR